MSLGIRILRLCVAVPTFLVLAAIMGTVILLVGLPIYSLEMLFSPRPKAPQEFRPRKDLSVRDRLALRERLGGDHA